MATQCPVAVVHRQSCAWFRAMIVAAATTAVALTASSAAAQHRPADAEDIGWRLGAGAGVQEVASRDAKGSPLVYAGVGFPLAVRFEGAGTHWSGGAQTAVFAQGFNGGRLTAEPRDAPSGGPRADSVSVDLTTWLQRAVADFGVHRLSAGLQISHWTFYRSYLYDPRQIGSVETWDAVVSADLRAGLSGQTDAWGWRVGASMAMAGRMMRPSYAVRGDDRIDLVEQRSRILTYGRWATVDRLQFARGTAAITRRLSDHWAVTAEYRIGWLSFREELPSRAFSQRAVLGAEFWWGH